MKAFIQRRFPDLPAGFTDALLDFLITQNISFSAVDNPSFFNLLEVCKVQKKIELPTRQSLSSKLVPNAYATSRNHVIQELRNATKVSLTTDGWNGPRGIQYIVLTCHYLTPTFDLKSVPIGFTTVAGSHSAVNLTNSVKEILTEFQVPIAKVTAITTDEGGAAPCIAETLDARIAEIHCACHLAQTALRNAYKQTTVLHPHLRDLVASVSNFAVAYNRREGFRKVFQACQLETGFTGPLISPSDTRWNYLLHTIRSAADNRRAIQLWTLQQSGLPKNAREPLTEDMESILTSDWELLSEFTSALKLFETFTNAMQLDTRPTLHNLIPSYVRLTNGIKALKCQVTSNEVKFFIDQALDWLETKFEPKSPDGLYCWDDTELLALALNPLGNVLDPHQSDLWERGIVLLKQRLASTQEQEVDVSVNPNRVAIEDQQDPEQWRYRLKTYRIDDDDIISSYRKIAACDPAAPETFWPRYKQTLPQIYDLAVSVLCIPASQTTSERVFSIMKHVISDLRTRMKPETAKQLLLLKWKAGNRNADIKRNNTRKRSDSNVAADPKRKATTARTREQQIRESIGDNANLDQLGALAASMEQESVQEVPQTDVTKLIEEVGDGEMQEDSDYDQDDEYESQDEEISDSEDYEAPQAKVPATPATMGAMRTRTRSSSVKLIINYVENEDGLVAHFDTPPSTSMLQLLGESAKYFEPHKEATINRRLCWLFDLNESGKRRFGNDRWQAAKYITRGKFTIVL
jgi:hypothetical protein